MASPMPTALGGTSSPTHPCWCHVPPQLVTRLGHQQQLAGSCVLPCATASTDPLGTGVMDTAGQASPAPQGALCRGLGLGSRVGRRCHCLSSRHGEHGELPPALAVTRGWSQAPAMGWAAQALSTPKSHPWEGSTMGTPFPWAASGAQCHQAVTHPPNLSESG